ncbi:MAG: LamG domain-containing protein, partial [Candidatus Nealsonbacteria bacterium]|nr:LamG domain-containing protein [Candidatus Nealsonbacteria bacterium]
TAQDFNPATTTAIGWDSELELDATGFTQSGSEIGVTQADDYLFLANLYEPDDGPADRQVYWQRWRENGATVLDYGQTARYSRDDGVQSNGNWSGIILDLENGDYVEAVSERLAAADPLNAVGNGLQGVRLSSLFTPVVMLTWDDTDNPWQSTHWDNGTELVDPVGDAIYTVNVGQVLVQNDPPQAKSLTIDGGEVEVQPTFTLDVLSAVSVNGGTLDVDGTLLAGPVSVASGAALEVAGTANTGAVTVASGAILDLAGTLNAPSLNTSGTNTIGAASTLAVTDALTVGSDLNMTGATLTTTDAAVTVAAGQTLTYDKALTAASLDLQGMLVRTGTGADASVTVSDSLTLAGGDLSVTGVDALLTTTNAAVTVAATRTLTYDKPLEVGSLDLQGTLDLTTVGNRVVTVNGGTMAIGSNATLTNPLEEVVLNAGTLNVQGFNGTALSVNLDDSGNGPFEVTRVAGVAELGNWNNMTPGGSGAATDMIDSAGAATTADVAWGGTPTPATWRTTLTIDDTDADDSDRMMKGYLDYGGNGQGMQITVDVTEIPYAEYDLYLYHESQGGDNRVMKISLDGGATFDLFAKDVVGDFQTAADFVEGHHDTLAGAQAGSGGNYILLSGLTESTLNIVTEGVGTGTVRSPVQGIQLVVPEVLDMTGTAISVTDASAVSGPASGINLGGLSMADASALTVSGGVTSFVGTTAAGSVTLETQTTTMPGAITAVGATIIKTGSADLVLDPDGSGMINSTMFDVQAGRLVAVQDATNPLGTAAVTIGNAELLLGAAGAAVTYDNAITATGAATLTADTAVTVGGANGLTLDVGSSLTVQATDGNTFNVAGNILADGDLNVPADTTLNLAANLAGTGNVAVPAGAAINVTGAASTVGMGGLDLAGSLALDAGLTDKTVAVNGGTMTVRDSATLSNVETIALNAGMLDLQATVLAGTVPANPVVHFKFDDATGLVADNDATLDGTNDGALTGFPTDDSQWITGVDGGALNFDGSNDEVVVTGYKGILGGGARSVTAWIKTTQTDKGIISWGNNTLGEKWTFRTQNSNGLPGTIRTEVNGGYVVGSTYLLDDQWHHVAAVLDPDADPDVNEVLLYVDGKLETISASAPEPINTGGTDPANDADVRIGNDFQGSHDFPGGIDDAIIYDRALTAPEIAAMYGGVSMRDVSAINLAVNGDSTVKSGAIANTGFAALNVADGVLTTEGKGTFSFVGTTIADTATATGFSSETDVDLGSVDGGGAAMTFDKTGAGNLAMSSTITGMQAATVDVQGGGLSMAADMAVTNLRTATDATVNTGGNAVTISDTFTLGDVDLGISGATMTASGSNLATATNLIAGGGTLTITPKYATKVLVVSDSSDPDVAGGSHNDDSTVALLKEMGYQVDTIGMGEAFNEGNDPFADQTKADAIAAADVILVSRRTNSGAYDNQRIQWNETAKPLLLMSGYLTRGTDKWGWTSAGSGNVADRTLTDMVVEAGQEGHEFLDGVDEPMSMFDWSTAPNAEAPK